MKVQALASAAGLALAGAAFGQFSGPYAPANWTFNANGGDGSVNTAGAPASIILTGNNNGSGPIDTDYTIMAAAAGNLSFSWLYNTIDTGTYDSAYYLINGVETFLANNTTPGAAGAVGPIAVNAGDVIGFRVRSADGAFGAGELTVSNFVGPVPAPGALALAAFGGLVAARRRR
jgi:MYXO-CTERM domain-containing protein